MHLKVLIPTHVLADQEVVKVVAEAQNGSFGMLPHHIDFTAALVPSILICETPAGEELYFAIDEGILVKCHEEVFVSTLDAVPGDDLHSLRDIVRERYLELDDEQRSARSALARLEAGVVRRFIELQESL